MADLSGQGITIQTSTSNENHREFMTKACMQTVV